MQRENEASSMAGQSASNVASDDYSSDLLKTQRNRDGSDPLVIKRAYFDNIFASRVNDQSGDQVHSRYASNYPRRKSRLGNSAKTRQVRNESNFQNMKQREKSAKEWLSNLVKKRHDAPMFQVTPYYAMSQTVNDVQYSDNGASLTILDGPRQSASNLPESSIHDRDTEDALIEIPIDRLHLRETSSVSHSTEPTRTRRDRNEIDFEVEQVGLNADNLFAETPVNCANERTSDYSAHRNSRRSEVPSRSNERDIAAEHRDDFGNDRSDRGFWTTRQTHLDRRNMYAFDRNRSGAHGSENLTNRLHESDDIIINDVRNEFTNANDSVNVIAIDADGFDVDAVSIRNQVKLDGISKIEDRTNIDSEYDSSLDLDESEIRPANCRNVACSKSSDDDVSVIGIKFGKAKESNKGQGYEGEDHFARVDEILTMPGNDNDTDINVDSEAPFTGFEGSQKFPVKINQKLLPVPPQVEKFDRRHFGPHKEDILEETSTWHPSTVLPDLPKSPSRDVLHRKTDDDVVDEIDEADNRSEQTTEMDEKRNDTYNKSWLPDTEIPEERLLGFSDFDLDEKLAVTSSIADSEFESAIRDRNDSDSRAESDITIPIAKPIEKTNITILGLFEMTHGTVSRPEGSSELQAAKLAVERVNELDILKRFRLRLIYNDTKVS